MSTKAIVMGAVVLGGLCAGRVVAADPAGVAMVVQPGDPALSGQPTMVPQTPVISSPIIVQGNAPAMMVPAQQPVAGTPITSQPADAPIPAVTGAPSLPPGSVCSPWSGPGGTGCCGPVGNNGPIMMELFLRNGITLPVAGGIFNNTLNAGYVFSAGARSLFFNPGGSAAWTIEYGFDYFYNNGNHPELVFDVFGDFVDIREYNRAAVHLSVGREWFVFKPAYQVGTNYRFGYDVGGRYGYSRVNFNLPDVPDQSQVAQSRTRRSDVFGGVLIGLSAEFEVPITNCTTFIGGLRGEWSYTFTDIIPTWDCDLQEVSIMFSMGLRF